MTSPAPCSAVMNASVWVRGSASIGASVAERVEASHRLVEERLPGPQHLRREERVRRRPDRAVLDEEPDVTAPPVAYGRDVGVRAVPVGPRALTDAVLLQPRPVG